MIGRHIIGLMLATWSLSVRAQTSGDTPAEIQRHIQHVQADLVPVLIGRVITSNSRKHSLSERMQALHVPGVSIAVIHDGALEWAEGFGVTRIGGPPVTAQTLFQAGSISKPVAALAALRLVQQGKLSLDADVNSYLVDGKIPSSPIANGSPVTLRELLSHTGGINVHGFPGYAVDAPVPDLVQILDGARPANTPPIHIETAPGKEWKYSGGGYIIMQELIVDVTKEPFPEFVQDTVLAPIGMIQSTYQQPLSLGLQLLAATPYGPDNTPIRGGAHTYPEMAAAGLWATPSDLARYGLEIVTSLRGQSNHVLSPEMTKQMLTPGLGNWGLGIEIGGSSAKPYFKHGGVNAGFESILFVYEQGGDGAVVMTNAQGGSILADEVMRSIATEYDWPDYRPIVLYSAKTVIYLIFAFILLSAIVALVFKLLAALYSKFFAARH